MKNLILASTIFLNLTMSAQVQWRPSQFQQVQEIMDCTIGDIAVARSQPYLHIRFCPQLAAATNQMFPGAGHFYYVHEYGHILGSNGEAGADIFAATQLAKLPGSFYYINAMVSQLYYRAQQGEIGRPGYGTPMERANRILSAALSANSNLAIESGLLVEK